jgi:hypothetical protein
MIIPLPLAQPSGYATGNGRALYLCTYADYSKHD